MLEKLIICDLYQVKKEYAYIKNDNFSFKYDLYNKCEFIDEVIVKKSFFKKFELREIITGTKIDTIYKKKKEFNNYDIIASKKEYDTFILVDDINKNPTIEDIKKYIKKHNAVNEYKIKLEKILLKRKVNIKTKQKIKNI